MKPRVFISSTYYDLKFVRDALNSFVKSLSYEPVLFEKGDIAFHHDKALEASCYSEVENCSMFVLILGGRYGSLSTVEASEEIADSEKLIDQLKSITEKEYVKARERDIPIYVFVENNVLAEYRTYIQNKDNMAINYAHVDSIKIFNLIDEIYAQKRNNLVKGFDSVEDIIAWLRDQWAGLFADLLNKKTEQATMSGLSDQISKLNTVAEALQTYNEEIVKTVAKDKSKKIISDVKEQRLISHRRRIMRKPLIQYIRNSIASEIKLNSKSVAEAIEKNEELSDFLTELKLNEEMIESLVENSSDIPRKDYADIREAYMAELGD